MKSIRALLIPAGLITALALPSASFAQVSAPQPPAAQHQRGRARHGRFMHAMRGLDLSTDQQSRIKALVGQFHQAHPKGSPRDPQAAKALHDQVMAVLTPAQQAQFKANMQAMRAKGPGERPDAGRGGMMQRFAALGLSDQQKTQIQSLLDQFHQAHPKGSPRDPQAMQTLRSQIHALLTPAQQQQLQQMQQNRDADGGGR